jgi:hypothetical protein
VDPSHWTVVCHGLCYHAARCTSFQRSGSIFGIGQGEWSEQLSLFICEICMLSSKIESWYLNHPYFCQSFCTFTARVLSYLGRPPPHPSFQSTQTVTRIRMIKISAFKFTMLKKNTSWKIKILLCKCASVLYVKVYCTANFMKYSANQIILPMLIKSRLKGSVTQGFHKTGSFHETVFLYYHSNLFFLKMFSKNTWWDFWQQSCKKAWIFLFSEVIYHLKELPKNIWSGSLKQK